METYQQNCECIAAKQSILFYQNNPTKNKSNITKHNRVSIPRLIPTSYIQVNSGRGKEDVFVDLEKIFDGWIGEHGTDSYIVVCEECNKNTTTVCCHK